MSTTTSFEDAFKNTGVPVFAGGRKEVTVTGLDPSEVQKITFVVNKTADFVSKVSPTLGNTVRSQLSVVLSAAQVAKGEMNNKPITYPGEVNTIAIVPIIPQFINFGSISNTTCVAQTGYPKDTWDVSLTAGSVFYLLGTSTAGYTTCGTPNYRFAIVILNDGLVEIGTTPKIDQFKIWSGVESRYTPFTTPITFDEPIEIGKAVYQYPTLGAMFIDWNVPFYWTAMPRATGTSSLRILGFAFAEYNVFGGGGNLWYA